MDFDESHPFRKDNDQSFCKEKGLDAEELFMINKLTLQVIKQNKIYTEVRDILESDHYT